MKSSSSLTIQKQVSPIGSVFLPLAIHPYYPEPNVLVNKPYAGLRGSVYARPDLGCSKTSEV